eukprot:scaffold33065_cov72-Skeletonema_dohrnii-CCMP3373.AAC.1
MSSSSSPSDRMHCQEHNSTSTSCPMSYQHLIVATIASSRLNLHAVCIVPCMHASWVLYAVFLRSVGAFSSLFFYARNLGYG